MVMSTFVLSFLFPQNIIQPGYNYMTIPSHNSLGDDDWWCRRGNLESLGCLEYVGQCLAELNFVADDDACLYAGKQWILKVSGPFFWWW